MLLKAILAKQQTSSKGVLYGWGNNSVGQISDNTSVNKSSPVNFSNASWKQVAAFTASAHTYGIRSDNTLWSWGDNTYGQLGIGTQTGKLLSPVATTTDTTWSKISLGNDHILAIKSNGTLWAWGDNANGQLGILSTTSTYSPVLVSGPASTSWSAISAGWNFSLAITSTGRLYSWGNNSDGQLGDSSLTTKSSPVLVSGPASTSWSIIEAAGYNNAFAITTQGTLYSWGNGFYGVLGDGTTTTKSVPVTVIGPVNSWKAVSSGGGHALGITGEGRLYAWGWDYWRAIGVGGTTNADVKYLSPILVSGPATTSWAVVAAGGPANYYNTSLAITSQGRLYAWGSNNFGQLGTSSATGTMNGTPTLVSGPASTSWSAIGVNYGTSLAYTTTSSLYAWGFNSDGQLGNLSTVNTSSPVLVSAPAGVTWSSIKQSPFYTSTSLSSTGQLYAWGSNSPFAFAPLGISSPVQIGSSSWTMVAAGRARGLAITTEGRLYSWGQNNGASIGDLTAVDKSSPVLVSGPASTSWSVVGSTAYSAYAITSEGRLYSWGYAFDGQLGNLSTTNTSSPVLVSGPAGTSWVSVTGGFHHVLAITNTKRLYAWGRNDVGQLGDLTLVNKSSPILVSGPASTSWSAIANTSDAAFAITTTGRLYAWGKNNVGQLGDLTLVNKSFPILVSGPTTTSWATIAGGLSHAIAITTAGRLYAWGLNLNGALGNLSTTNTSSPILVSGPVSTSWSLVTAGQWYSIAVTSLT